MNYECHFGDLLTVVSFTRDILAIAKFLVSTCRIFIRHRTIGLYIIILCDTRTRNHRRFYYPISRLCVMDFVSGSGSFPHPPQGGLIPPNFRTTPPPRLQGEMRERVEGEEGGKGKGEEKGREGTPKGWLTPPCSKS